MVTLRSGSQEAGMGVCGQEGKHLPPKSQKTTIAIQFVRFSIDMNFNKIYSESCRIRLNRPKSPQLAYL